jgi:type IV pilus assembly protein PilN
MIRVNLLPVRAARKKENVRRQVSIFFLTVFFGICAMGYFFLSLNRAMGELNDQILNAQQELTELKAISRKVKEIKDKLDKLNAKMDIIQKLDTNRTRSVRIMDALTSLVVAQKMWLTNLKDTGGRMTLNGVAVDNKTIADFMRRLEGSPYFDQVNLVSSKQVAMGEGRKFNGFNINCMVSVLNPPQ